MKEWRFVANKPIVVLELDKLKKAGISEQELKEYFPRYILGPTLLCYGRLKRFGLLIVGWFLRIIVYIFLKPRRSAGSLGQSEVDEIYAKEANTYNRKHHLTTRGMDLVWRRMAGWFATSIARNNQNSIKMADICTGTGLAAREISSILKEWEVDADITGLDYSANMLTVAQSHASNGNIKFIRGDATDLAGTFSLGSMDAVTQVFGIGGISEPLKVFHGILQILKLNGQFLMIDMHKPIPEQAGEWPFFLKWWRFPILEMVIYEEYTLPVILKRLWGWRDTTLCFYFLPLVTYRDTDGRCWGFKVRAFEREPQRWWFALPLMPIAKIIVEKIEISEETAGKRIAILEACNIL